MKRFEKMHIYRSIWGLSLLIATASCGNEEQVVSPEYKVITEAVYAAGSLQPHQEYQVFAPVSGILNQKMVNVGDKVTTGQLMFSITHEAPDLRMQNAQQQLTRARRESSSTSPLLAELQLDMENARQQYITDSLNYIRQKNLIDHNATSKVALEEAELKFVSSKNSFQATQQRLAQRQDELKDQLSEAQIEYRLAAEEKGNALIESRIDGKIYSILPEVGEMVNTNEPLAMVGDSSEFLLKLTVDERDIAKVKTGQEVVFTMDVLADTTFKAQVSKIYPSMNAEDRTFTVEAEVKKTALPLYAGASVEANIIIQQKQNALVIPQSALIGEDSVMVEQDGEKKKIKVRKGAENLSMVEVLSGLSENSKIILP